MLFAADYQQFTHAVQLFCAFLSWSLNSSAFSGDPTMTFPCRPHFAACLMNYTFHSGSPSHTRCQFSLSYSSDTESILGSFLLVMHFYRIAIQVGCHISRRSRYSCSLWAGRSGDRIPVTIFRTRPDRPRGPPSVVYSGYWVFFAGAKRPGRGVNHLSPSSAEVKERVRVVSLLCMTLTGLI